MCIRIHEVEKIPYKRCAVVSQSAAQTCAGDQNQICANTLEDIYFFEVNTKYISSNVMKISVNSRVRSMRYISSHVMKISVNSGVRSTSEFSDIFNT